MSTFNLPTLARPDITLGSTTHNPRPVEQSKCIGSFRSQIPGFIWR
jgi:hypothetical protein